MLDDISALPLPKLAPYIKGEKFLPGQKAYKELNIDLYHKFIDKLNQHDYAKAFFKNSDHYSDFFNACPDFNEWIPKQKKDLFYAVKTGYFYKGVPPYVSYVVQLALKNVDSPNMVPIQMNSNLLTQVFTKGYLNDGITLYDVICNTYKSSYTVIDESHYKCKLSSHTELYIPTEDMVALVPNNIADSVDTTFLESLHLTQDGLIGANNIALKRLCGHKGIINSHFDLRGVI